MQGKLIVIDGTDGSGKTTQAELLIERLKHEGREVQTISFPQYNQKSAGLVEEYLSGKYGSANEVDPKVSSIFYAADRFDASFKMRQWIQQGAIVVANRYVSSNMGHQGGKIINKEEREKFLDWLYELEYGLFNLPVPDANVILYIPPAIAQQLAQNRHREDWRGKTRDIHEENIEHLKAAAESYLYIAEKYPNFNLINCAENNELFSREQIHEKIWEQIAKML
jgi:dTMP kinase